MNLLPAAPATDFRAEAQPETAADQPRHARRAPHLAHLLRAGEGGTLGRVTLGENDVQGMAALKKELKAILKDPTLPFDQALIKVDPDLSTRS